jgi:hypothetical protein
MDPGDAHDTRDKKGSGTFMLDRQKVEAILTRRFPGAAHQHVAAAANAIMGLDDEWDEIGDRDHYLGCHSFAQCTDACYLARHLEHDVEFRLLRRRSP